MKRALVIIKRIIGSHLFVMTIYGMLQGITAIAPDILTNPVVLCNYFGFIFFNAFIQDVEKKDTEKEWQTKIDKLQKQIDKIKEAK